MTKFRLLITLCFLLLQAAATGKVLISFNPEECSSCIKALEYFKTTDHNNPNILVLQEKYKEDSALLVRNFFLEKYNMRYIWSDSLYDAIAMNNLSTVRYISGDGSNMLNLPLKLVDRQVVDYFNLQQKTRDTISFPAGRNMDNDLVYSDKEHLIFCSKFRNEIRSYNLLTKTTDYEIQVTDSINEASFNLGLGPNTYQMHKEMLQSLQVPQAVEIESFWSDSDTLYTIMKYKFIAEASAKDTVVDKFYLVDKFFKGRCISIKRVPLLLEDGKDSFFILSYMQFWNGNLYSSAVQANNWDKPRRFLAKFAEQGDAYVFDRALDYVLPPVYKNHNYSNTVFCGDYFTLPLEDKIYNRNSKEIISVNHFPRDNFADLTTPPKMYTRTFKISKDYVWILYWKAESKHFWYLKYDRHTQAIVYDKPISGIRDRIPVIDDFDFNYLFIQEKDNKMLRRSITSF